MSSPPEAEVAFVDGYPKVPRFSSMLQYLQLCKTGARLWCDMLDATVVKQDATMWEYDEELLDSRALVQEMRSCLKEDDEDLTNANLNKLYLSIEPVDKVAIKREVAEATEEEEEEGQGGRKLCIIDVTGERAVETETFDGGPSSSDTCTREAIFESYALPLHLRLPTQIGEGSPTRSRSVSPAPSLSLSQPSPSAGLVSAMSEELAVAAVDNSIGMQPCALSPPRDVPAPMLGLAPASAPALKCFEGMRVVVKGLHGYVWMMSKQMAGVAYDRFQGPQWAPIRLEEFELHSAKEEGSLPEQAVEGVIAAAPEAGTKIIRPEGILVGKQEIATPNAWQWFSSYQPPPAPSNETERREMRWAPEPRLPAALQAGQQVECKGKVRGIDGSSVTFVAVAQSREKPPAPRPGKEPKLGQWRRFAVVADTTGKLAMAELMSPDVGYIIPATPSATLSPQALAALQCKVPDFLEGQVVSTVQTWFSRAPLPRLRSHAAMPARAAASVTAAAALTAAAPAAGPALPSWSTKHDLKGVKQSSLAALGSEQLCALCAARTIAVPIDADAAALLAALVRFQRKEGRVRRSDTTPSVNTPATAAATTAATAGGDSNAGGDSGSDHGGGSKSDGSEVAAAPKAKKSKQNHRQDQEKPLRRKGKHRQHRPPSPSSISSGSASPPRQKLQRSTPGSSSSSMSTPPDVRNAREELDAIEAAKIARLKAKVNRYERKQHEKKQKEHKRKHRS